MADGRLRLLGVPPGGLGVQWALGRLVREETLVTALDDALLRFACDLSGLEDGAEFLPFGAVLARTLDVLGTPRKPLATQGQTRAMVGLAMEDLSAETPLSASAGHPGTVRLVADRLHELAVWGIGPGEMRALSEAISPGCAAKLLALAEVADLVADSMDASHRATAADYVHECFSFDQTNGIHLPHLIAFLGIEDRPLYEKWFVWAAHQGCDVDLVVEYDSDDSGTFGLASRVASRLELDVVPASALGRASHGLWTSCLFGGKPNQAPRPQVTISRAGDSLAESEWALRRCMELHGEGVPWSSMGVFARDAARYAPSLLAASARLGVPVRAPRPVPLLSNGFAALVLASLQALASPKVSGFSRLARNPYFEAPKEFVEALWSVSLQIDRASEDPWGALREWLEARQAQAPWACTLIEWRAEAVESSQRFKEWLDRFRALIGDSTLIDSVAAPDSESRDRDLLAQTVLQRSLANHAFVYDQSGRPDMSLRAFVNQCEAIWKDETVQIPAAREGVRVVSSGHVFGPVAAVFAVGLLEGSLPRRRREDPLLFDQDRAEISKAWGVQLLDSADKARQERDEFVRICLSATDELTLSYPQSTGDSDSVPAFYLLDIEASLEGQVALVSRSRILFAPDGDACLAEADRILREALDRPRSWPEPSCLEGPDNLARVRLGEGEEIRLDEAATAIECPFQAAARFRLGLRGEPVDEGPWRLASLPVEAQLPSAATAEAAMEALWEAYGRLEEKASARLDDYSLAMLKRAADRAFKHWVEAEFEGRTNLVRDPESVRYQVPLKELGFGKYSGTVQAVSTIKGVPVAEMFVLGNLKAFGLQDLDGDRRKFTAAVWAVAAGGKGTGPRGVLFASSSGAREFVLLGHPARDFPKLPMTNVFCRPSGASDFVKATTARLGQGVKAMERSVMEAVPGQHCGRCSFGELCRSSIDYGDRLDPFR